MFIEPKKQLKTIIWVLLLLLIAVIVINIFPKILALRTIILDIICYWAVKGHGSHFEIISFLFIIFGFILSVTGITIKDVKKSKHKKRWFLVFLILIALYPVSFFINLYSTRLRDIFQTRLESIENSNCATPEELKDLKFTWSQMTKWSTLREINDKLDRYSKRRNIKLPR